MQPKTIEVFLPDGEPSGIRIAEVKNRTGKLLAFPRKQLSRVQADVDCAGIYFLFGTDQESGNRPLVYIGQAKNCRVRLGQHHHDVAMDFWNTAAVFIAKDGSFGTTEIEVLERLAVTGARNAPHYVVRNDKLPPVSNLSHAQQSQVDEQFECLGLLLPAIGYPVFVSEEQEDPKGILMCHGAGVEAQGRYTDEGLVVLKGSRARLNVAPSCSIGVVQLREQLKDQGILKEADGEYLFTENYTFTSPSLAAGVILGRSENGWRVWKDGDNRTLDSLAR